MKVFRFARALGISLLLVPAAASAQVTLRGSPASVERIHRQALVHQLTFYDGPASVRRAVRRGDLVALSSSRDLGLAGVRHPYVLPSTHTFLNRLARQYRSACGERLIVTSGVRPGSYRLPNSVTRTVHPTGMAVDLRRPRKARCASWLRETLLRVEGYGALDAVEERRPPHFHVAVFPGPYRRYASAIAAGREPPRIAAAPARKTEPARTRGAARPAPAKARERVTYRVRKGDSLWNIARRHGTSVERIRDANDLRTVRLQPGKLLVIPGAR